MQLSGRQAHVAESLRQRQLASQRIAGAHRVVEHARLGFHDALVSSGSCLEVGIDDLEKKTGDIMIDCPWVHSSPIPLVRP